MFSLNPYPVRTFWETNYKKAIPEITADQSAFHFAALNAQIQESSVYGSLSEVADNDKLLEGVLNSAILSCGGSMHSIKKKWTLAAKNKVKHLVINATEGEPFTFKDYYLMENYPMLVVEALAVAAKLLGVKKVHLGINSAYMGAGCRLVTAWTDLKSKHSNFPFMMDVTYTPELYVIGEETSLINFFEGGRGEPRIKPPLPMEKGLFGEPTLVSNVETICWVLAHLTNQDVFNNGFKKLSTLIYGEEVMVVEATIGMPFTELAAMVGASSSAYVEVGGVSGTFLTMQQLNDAKWSNESLASVGAFVGSGTVRFFDDLETVGLEVGKSLAFFESNTCGQCTPCRVGTQRLVYQFGAKNVEHDAIFMTGKAMKLTSLCGLGKAASNPVCTYLANIKGVAAK
ncbi:hypothetical protein OTK49_20705 [Vibrio coralliirubri]|uniref:NADH-ubiquinone oxidoreductase-F iron-sulfur binding region domain-containing protein n=1 Tax=Vibrio coralliirubri TaxID=1516159 RepID=UPI002284930F|nr:NADH-ubiquinone oxidoreductase-F iron-sulfur binding region domain-containing protein [Vibrio coralliirubri]MCY9864939.1 hypothetical protein [Vibrio coralliirubri]